ncbi:MAG: response regulator transcription factor [Solirubrobacterales bacterium]|nr:response regulator transcription factor [Solirubrobacterales bacterium]
MTDRLRVLIADHAAMRAGIALAAGRDIEICAEASTAEEAIRAAMREQPDACLVAREIPGDGIAAVRGICRAAPNAAVVVLSQIVDADDLLDSVRAGAIGYVPSVIDQGRLEKVLAAIRANEAVIPRSMVIELMLELRSGGDASLTSRESQVLGMLRRGHSTAEISQRLSIAPVTVRRHISELVRKLGVENRSALAVPKSAPRGRSAAGANETAREA